MFRAVFGFELRLLLRSPLLWTTSFAFALLAFLATSTDHVVVGGAVGNVYRNAPSVVLGFLSVFSVLGLFVVTAFFAAPLLRDFELRTDAMFFATPLRPWSYVAGRLAAGVLGATSIYVLVCGAMLLGAAMPWIDPERLGPTSLLPHLWGLSVVVLPNLLFCGALLSLLAVTGRSLRIVYVGVMAFFVLWTASGFLLSDFRHDAWSALIDPFGGRAMAIAKRYWSAEEHNTRLPALEGLLLANRLLWLCLSAICCALTFRLFRPEPPRARLRRRAAAAEAFVPRPPRTPTQVSTARRVLAQLGSQLRFDVAGVLRSLPFLVLLAFGVFSAMMQARSLEHMWGTETLPVTGSMLRVLEQSYAFLLVVVVGHQAGELVFRERSAKIAAITDTLPVPTWVPLVAKQLALSLVVVAFMAAGALACIVMQLARGYTHLEPGLYASGVLLLSADFLLYGVAAVFLHVLFDSRLAGHLGYLLLLVGVAAMPSLHLEHNLYTLAGLPATPYSDMNGYGHFLTAWGWFATYWSLFAAMLGVLASALWVRGVAPSFGRRLRAARAGLGRGRAVALALLALGIAGTGAFIHHNTNVLNPYYPEDVLLDRQAHRERTYQALRDVPQPRLVRVSTEVDIFPAERRVAVLGRHEVENHHGEPIVDLHVFLHPRAEATDIAIPGAALIAHDPLAGYRHFRLSEPLVPGARLAFTYALERRERGFTNDGMPPQDSSVMPSPLNENGTVLNSDLLMPDIGYVEDPIKDRSERQKRGLGALPRVKKLEDPSGRRSAGFAGESEWIQFETTVSTSADQTALAPGYLTRSWTQDGRRYFHYATDRPMMPYYCYVSARWQVARDAYEGVAIEVYHHPQHGYNVARMIDATKKSLAYYTANFGPYQHRQVRILEFPGYAQYAQSFAGTISYSEAIGFVADLRDPGDVDYVYYVTAHEVAHQWWPHQAVAAEVQGASALSESLSQYAALMVMEKQYGKAHMRKFLKYELDKYLRGRGGELVEELPLMRVESQQYIHYHKGSLVFYRLREEMGEEALNRALARYLKAHAFKRAPHATSHDLLSFLRAELPHAQEALLDELFARIVLHDNRVASATAKRRTDGRYDVTLALALARSEADGRGKKTPLPVDVTADVAVFARPEGGSEDREEVLFLERRRLTTSQPTVTITVDREPYEAGVDPFNKIIDENAHDNRRAVVLVD